MQRRILWVLAIIATVLVNIFLYTLLHEGGHALMGLLFGGKITVFNLNFWNLSAYVGLDGEFTTPQNALISVAGVSLPVLVWFVLFSLLPRARNAVAQLFTLFFSVGAVNALLAWIVLPLIVLAGERPGDDSVNFLGYTGVHPLVVSGGALLVYCAAIWWFLRRLGGRQAVTGQFHGGSAKMDTPEAKRALGVLGAAVVVIAVAGLVTGAFSNGGSFYGDPGQTPEGFELLAEIDLSQQSYDATEMVSFVVDEPQLVMLFINPSGVNTSYLDLRLARPDGEQQEIMHGEDYRAQNDRLQMGWELEPGTYSIVLTSAKSPGVLNLYWKPGSDAPLN